jgi:uncharacterized protein involved in response to NO
MFTRNATGDAAIRSIPALDVLTLAAMAVVVALDIWDPGSRAAAFAAGLAGALALARSLHWGARRTLGEPLLWSLHAGYLWIPLGLLLRATAQLELGLAIGTLWIHALTVGGVGSLTLAMMARVSLGHTGRPLVASGAMPFAFAAINAAAVVRVIVPLFVPEWYAASLSGAALLWSLAFAAFLWVYAPMLLKPRLDGKPG